MSQSDDKWSTIVELDMHVIATVTGSNFTKQRHKDVDRADSARVRWTDCCSVVPHCGLEQQPASWTQADGSGDGRRPGREIQDAYYTQDYKFLHYSKTENWGCILYTGVHHIRDVTVIPIRHGKEKDTHKKKPHQTHLNVCRSTVGRTSRWQPVLGWLAEILSYKPV